MEYSAIRESIIAQERRRDLQCQAEQARLFRLAKVGRASGVEADRPARTGTKLRMMWRRAVV